MSEIQDYIISGGQAGKTRLNVLADVLQNYTHTLLYQQGVTAGMSFLDVGCGGGNVSVIAASMVGDKGKVTAIDFDKEIIALAQQDAVKAGIHNIAYSAMNVYDIEYDSEFDVAYARFLLSHLKNPADILRKMKQSVKPGGKIIIEDVQFSGHFCYPASNAFEEYLRFYTLAAQQNGADANIGPSLPALFREAGIRKVGFDIIQPAFSTGAGKWMAYITLDKIRNTLAEHNIATPQAIDSILHELEGFTKDEQTIISLPRIFRVWGV